MKKIILAAALTVTIGTTFALDSGVSTPAGTQPLAHLPHDYNSTATIVKFNMDLELTNGDDDIYFQGGKRVIEQDLDKTKIYCEIDTDEVVGVSSPKVSIKKGETRIVKDVQEQYHSATHSYEVDLDLSASEYAFIDELECSIPASNMRDILVKDLLEVTGGAITLEYLSLETFK
jgi:hypothetical protein